MRAPIAALAALLLSSCWEGDNLYSAADARPAIAPGLYRMVSDDGDEPITIRVSVLYSGMTQMTAGGETHDFPVAPLDAEGRAIVHWVEPTDPEPRPEAYELYYLIEHRSNGDYAFHMPACEGEEGDIARAAGAAVRPSPNIPVCRFRDRASLESALRRLRPDSNSPQLRLIPIPNGQG